MERRRFIEIVAGGATGCAADCALASVAPHSSAVAQAGGKTLAPRILTRAKLVDADGRAILAKSLKPQHNYVFNYPFEATPCFLLVLDRVAAPPTTPPAAALVTEKGERYAAPGGVGPAKNIVAYSAICAHQLAYPTRQVSFISYRPKPSPINPKGRIIGCCADKSVYDPFDGARVVSGPAPQPLAAIILEHDPHRDELYAVGVAGSDKFDAFFQKYEFKLALDMGSSGKVRAKIGKTTALRDLAAYSTQTAQC